MFKLPKEDLEKAKEKIVCGEDKELLLTALSYQNKRKFKFMVKKGQEIINDQNLLISVQEEDSAEWGQPLPLPVHFIYNNGAVRDYIYFFKVDGGFLEQEESRKINLLHWNHDFVALMTMLSLFLVVVFAVWLMNFLKKKKVSSYEREWE